MTPTNAHYHLRTEQPLQLVIFDCDGVLIDSEHLCDLVIAEELTHLGWPVTPEECHRLFLGLTFQDTQPVVEARLGRSLGDNWVAHVVARVVDVMARESTTIEGAVEALDGVDALGLPWRVASNSSFEEMEAKFTRTGLWSRVEGRLHSGPALIARGGRGKPAPDLFLEAAAAQGVPPGACVVIEDSVPGIRGARAAGMACLGYDPTADGTHLTEAGAVPFTTMRAIPALLRPLLRSHP